jgi:AP-3 complex subunit delta-1
LEVQERAVFAVELLKLVVQSVADGLNAHICMHQCDRLAGEPMYAALPVLFEGELNPVHVSAIEHVPLPEGLNLDEWIHEPPPEHSFDVCVASSD